MKVVGSWSKPDLNENFIARKKVDWSIFEYGTHIPLEFLEFFHKANGGERLALGEKRDIILIFEGIQFEANISNIDRKSFEGDTVQIRYNSNSDLKKYLINKLQASYNYLYAERDKKKEVNDKSKVIVPDDLAEYLDFYETDKPFYYRVEIRKNMQQEDKKVGMAKNIWWVNQGTTLNKAKDEGCLWAPLKDKSGKALYHWETMKELKKDDVVLHYANGALRYVSNVLGEATEAPRPDSLKTNDWNEQGRLIYVDYNELNPPILLDTISSDLLKISIMEGPLDYKGGVKQGYLFRFTKEALLAIQKLTSETNWPDFSKIDAYNEENQTIGVESADENVVNNFDIKKEIDRISEYIRSKGFTFSIELIKNFYLSLKSKPFVILAGTSGTGKSKLVKLFAEALGATSENGRYSLVPVKPDWSDATDLLGYRDLHGEFHPGILTSIIKKAMDDISKPYFICLDEMNLARVEYYLSDILSVMETRIWDEEKIITDRLISEELFSGDTEAKKIYSNIYIPENLYIIGTVNMDETTFPFSKKVLDRANTIEFSHVDFDYNFNKPVSSKPICLGNSFLKSEFLLLDNCEKYVEVIDEAIVKLKEINENLKKANLHFGYRIRDEICYYAVYSSKYEIMAINQAMDNEILQKILPRIQGSSMTIKRALIDLFKVCISNQDEKFNHENSGINVDMSNYIKNNSNIPYINSALKIEFMMRRFEEDGFTSYWL